MVLEQNIDIFCLCETFLNNEFSDNELLIPGYDFIRKDRNSHGGCLIIYIKENLACIHREDLEAVDTEMLWVEVRNNVQKLFLICYCYRSPSALNLWTEKCEQAIEKANLEAKEIIMLGDFNFNLLRENTETRHWLHITEFQGTI